MAKQKIPTQQIAKDDKALEAALSMVNKQFGEGSLVRLGDATKMNVETISTGSVAIDLALGVGGLPRGRIVEIASVAGFQPIPYIAVYGASKAFVVSYSRAINQELKSRKIKVTCVCPFWTKTAFFDRATDTKAKNEVVSYYAAMYKPEDVVKKAIKDSRKGKELSICGFIARSQVRLVNIFPKKIVMLTWLRQQKLKKKYEDK